MTYAVGHLCPEHGVPLVVSLRQHIVVVRVETYGFVPV